MMDDMLCAIEAGALQELLVGCGEGSGSMSNLAARPSFLRHSSRHAEASLVCIRNRAACGPAQLCAPFNLSPQSLFRSAILPRARRRSLDALSLPVAPFLTRVRLGRSAPPALDVMLLVKKATAPATSTSTTQP